MQLFTRVLLLSLTALAANAWPRIADEQSFLRMVFAQAGIEDRALSPAENACWNSYQNASNQLLNQLSNATNKCEVAANSTTVKNNQNINATVTQIRSQLVTLQQNVQRCINETDNQLLVNCTINYFDADLKLLDNSNSQAYKVQSQIAADSNNLSLDRSNCVTSAVSEFKVKTIETANDYTQCLNRIPYQRDQLVQKEQPQQAEPIPVQPFEQQSEQKPVQNVVQQPEQKPVQNVVQQPEQKPVPLSDQQPQAQPELQPHQPANN